MKSVNLGIYWVKPINRKTIYNVESVKGKESFIESKSRALKMKKSELKWVPKLNEKILS